MLPALRERFEAIVPPREAWSLVRDPDESQTLLFHFPRVSSGTAPAYLTPAVKLEFGARSDPWPVEHRTITSFVMEQFPDLFEKPRVEVRALTPVRTFWEKVMLLHEEGFRPPDRQQRSRLSRHYYDIARLIEAGVGRAAANDKDLFARVAAHRAIYFRQTWVDYATLAQGQLRIVPAPDREAAWRRDYDAMRGEMLGGNPPTFDEILTRVREFENEFNLGPRSSERTT